MIWQIAVQEGPVTIKSHRDNEICVLCVMACTSGDDLQVLSIPAGMYLVYVHVGMGVLKRVHKLQSWQIEVQQGRVTIDSYRDTRVSVLCVVACT